ncbi:MAG: hypothetical protein GY715_12580 [Planctomycetes bacterium]|nr:hypothetical protein [Planctomycetota bacterium]
MIPMLNPFRLAVLDETRRGPVRLPRYVFLLAVAVATAESVNTVPEHAT